MFQVKRKGFYMRKVESYLLVYSSTSTLELLEGPETKVKGEKETTSITTLI